MPRMPTELTGERCSHGLQAREGTWPERGVCYTEVLSGCGAARRHDFVCGSGLLTAKEGGLGRHEGDAVRADYCCCCFCGVLPGAAAMRFAAEKDQMRVLGEQHDEVARLARLHQRKVAWITDL